MTITQGLGEKNPRTRTEGGLISIMVIIKEIFLTPGLFNTVREPPAREEPRRRWWSSCLKAKAAAASDIRKNKRRRRTIDK